MKILQINNHHKIVGGAERYYFDLSALLQKKGHEVAFFSTKESGALETRWQKYFLSKIDYKRRGAGQTFRKLGRVFYSLEAKKQINLVLDRFKPDIVHIHNIYYYISPSILYEIKRRGIPIIQTVHDYQLITPSINFFHNGKICEISKPHRFYKVILHKCVHNSYPDSLIATVTEYIQVYLNLFKNNVDIFLAPSLFMKKKLTEYKFGGKEIIHQPYFTTFSTGLIPVKKTKEKYVLFFGRLVEEKGVLFLLDLAKRLPSVTFKLVGKFSTPKFKKDVLYNIRHNSIKNITLLQHKGGADLEKIISDSCFVIAPSLWYEVFCISILESNSFGKPVIASRIAGIPEIIKDNKTGILFDTGNIEDCMKKVLLLWNNPSLVKRLGKNAKKFVEVEFGPEKHYKKIMQIYNKALNKSSKVAREV